LAKPGLWPPGLNRLLLALVTAGNGKDVLEEGIGWVGAILNSQDLPCHLVGATASRGMLRMSMWLPSHSHPKQNEARLKET
jgi:hypothetical protein